MQKIINNEIPNYFTDVTTPADEIYSVKFTNVNGNASAIIDYFTTVQRALCNRMQKEIPSIPYAGYRIIERTEKDARIFGQQEKTSIMLTAVNARFISKVIEAFTNKKETHCLEIFLKEKTTKTAARRVKELIVETGAADRNLLRERECLPNYMRADSRCPDYALYLLMKLAGENIERAQTSTRLEIAGEHLEFKIELFPGANVPSIGIDYGVTGFRYRRRQTFGYWYRRKRRYDDDIPERKPTSISEPETFSNLKTYK